MSENTDHISEVENYTDWAISRHLVNDHGYRDVWPFASRSTLLEQHSTHHTDQTTQESSDNSQVSVDKIAVAVGDGQPGTEDEVTVASLEQTPLLERQRIAELEAEVEELRTKLSNETLSREQRISTERTQAARRAVDDYKERVREQVRHYIDSGDLCKDEARKINEALELDMTFGWVITANVEITLKGVEEEISYTRSVENDIETAVKEALENVVTGDDLDWDYVSVDVSCEEDDE